MTDVVKKSITVLVIGFAAFYLFSPAREGS